ncbi:hypothetical protein HA402_000911 [Bradysia odoriphaga]|nr:hypothetical protein HA402_000911 [Bradysia odoriphaga]
MEMLVAQYSNLEFVPPALSMMLKQRDVEQWVLDIGSSDLVLFPVSNARNVEDTATHWYLLTYNRQTNHSSYYNSLHSYGEMTNDNVPDYCGKINEFMNAQRNQPQQQQHRLTVVPCTQQNNGNDCGVHVILNAEAATKSLNTNSGSEAVSNEAVTKKRRQMAQDLRAAITEQSLKDNSNDDKIPERAEHRQAHNIPLHSGVKVKSGRAQRRAKYVKKRQDAKKATKAARFGKPAKKKLKAKRLNLGIVTKPYTKPIPATSHGNRIPRSKANNKPRQKKTVRKVLHRQRSTMRSVSPSFAH